MKFEKLIKWIKKYILFISNDIENLNEISRHLNDKVYQFDGSISHGAGEVTSVIVFVRVEDFKNKAIKCRAISRWAYETGKDDIDYTWGWSKELWSYDNLPDEIKREIKIDHIL